MQLESLGSLTIIIHWPPHHTTLEGRHLRSASKLFLLLPRGSSHKQSHMHWDEGFWKPWIRGGSTKVWLAGINLDNITSYGTVLSQCIMGYKLQSRQKSHSVLQHTGSYIIQQKIPTKSALEIGMWLPVNNNNNKKLKWCLLKSCFRNRQEN